MKINYRCINCYNPVHPVCFGICETWFACKGCCCGDAKWWCSSAHPFTTMDGKETEYIQNGLIHGYNTGDEVDIIYEVRGAGDACMNTFGALYGFATIGIIGGLLFIVLALLGVNTRLSMAS